MASLNRGVHKLGWHQISENLTHIVPSVKQEGSKGVAASLEATKMGQKRGIIMSTDLLKIESFQDVARKSRQNKSYLQPEKGWIAFVNATKIKTECEIMSTHFTVSPGGNKPMCVFYQTCVEKTQYLPVWVFPHMFGYFHTYVQ